VEFLPNLINIPVPTIGIIPGINLALTLDLGSDIVRDFFFFIRGVKFGNLT